MPTPSPLDILQAGLEMAEEGQRDQNGYLDEPSHNALASLLPMLQGGQDAQEGPPQAPGSTEVPEGGLEPGMEEEQAPEPSMIERPEPDDLVQLPALLIGKLSLEGDYSLPEEDDEE